VKHWLSERWHRVLRRLPYDLRITLGSPYYRRGRIALNRAIWPIDLSPLVKALSAGGYSSGPVTGGRLVIEDLSAVMACVTFDAPWSNPKWWQIWKWASKDYMFLLRYQQKHSRIKFRRDLPKP
jgi:hypothetical protein